MGYSFNRRSGIRAWLLVACWFSGHVCLASPSGVKPLIQIGVEVVEVDERKTHKLGIQWLDKLHVMEASVPSLLSVGTLARDQIFADLQLMMEHETADLLADPKLVTRDGTTATFHSGGEIPYAVSGSLGTSSVEFKPYGVDLKINPHLDENQRIVISLNAEVSGLDNQNSVTLAGNTVPGIRSRQVSSQLTLEPGATLMLAGLIQTEKEISRRGIPGLMQIPLLKYLFSYKKETRKRTSIVVFVTPTVLDGLQSRVNTLPEAHE